MSPLDEVVVSRRDNRDLFRRIAGSRKFGTAGVDGRGKGVEGKLLDMARFCALGFGVLDRDGGCDGGVEG